MSNADIDRIMERVKKCLALAESTHSENEAATAISQAQKLMKKYGISKEDITVSSVTTAITSGVTKNRDRLPKWQVLLVTAISNAFDCSAYSSLHCGGRRVEFVGIGASPTVAAYAFGVLNRQLIAARNAYIGRLPKYCTRKYKTAVGNSFAEGWVLSAAKKAGDLFDREMPPEVSDAVDAYERKQYGQEKPEQQKTTSSAYVYGALQDGLKAGSAANIYHGVSESERQKMIGAAHG